MIKPISRLLCLFTYFLIILSGCTKVNDNWVSSGPPTIIVNSAAIIPGLPDSIKSKMKTEIENNWHYSDVATPFQSNNELRFSFTDNTHYYTMPYDALEYRQYVILQITNDLYWYVLKNYLSPLNLRAELFCQFKVYFPYSAGTRYMDFICKITVQGNHFTIQ